MSYRKRYRKFNRKYNNRKTSPTLVIIGIILAISLFSVYKEMIKNQDAQEATSNVYSIVVSNTTGKYIYYEKPGVPKERDDVYVMYNLLSDEDKQVYNLFLDLVEHRNGDKYQSSIVISDNKRKILGDDHLWCVYYAMFYDHPEYFFLMSSPDVMQCSYYNQDNYYIYLYSMKTETEKEKQQISKFNSAANEFMKDIDSSLPDEEKELAIHDKLISLVSYGYDLYETSNLEETNHDLGYFAYGALVSDSSGKKNHAVCNGYALAFEYLCQLADIPCCVITGDAYGTLPNTDQDSTDHAWNVVKIDGRWYEVDTTWDDNEVDTYRFYNKTTAEMESLLHIRGTTYTGTSEDIAVFRNKQIPVAE